MDKKASKRARRLADQVFILETMLLTVHKDNLDIHDEGDPDDPYDVETTCLIHGNDITKELNRRYAILKAIR